MSNLGSAQLVNQSGVPVRVTPFSELATVTPVALFDYSSEVTT